MVCPDCHCEIRVDDGQGDAESAVDAEKVVVHVLGHFRRIHFVAQEVMLSPIELAFDGERGQPEPDLSAVKESGVPVELDLANFHLFV